MTDAFDISEVSAREWDVVLASAGIDDTYFSSAYLESAALLGQGRPVFLSLATQGGIVVFPALVRDAAGRFRDVTTPMGYGGPLAAGDNPPVEAFFEAYRAWCSASRVIATFVRFQPTQRNHELARGRWHVERVGRSVAWRLEGADEHTLLAGMARHHRRVVRRAPAGIVVCVERSPATLGAFAKVHRETMLRQHASEFYFFPEAYWSHLTGRLAKQLVRADAFAGDDLVATTLSLSSGRELHYHLGASSARGRAMGANHFLFWRTAAWAAEQGFALYHLGGGVGGNEDSLFEFKRRFDPDGLLPAFLGKAVHDEPVYARLTGTSTIDYRGYFPAYRRPP